MHLPQADVAGVASVTNILEKRQRCYNSFYYYDCNGSTSAWYSYGRWVVLGGVIGLFILLFVCLSCITARRRRSRGIAPYRGTGWMAPNHGPVNYYPQGGAQTQQTQQPYTQPQGGAYYSGTNTQDHQPAPEYSQYGGGQNQGYYAQQNGVDMQPLSNTYQPNRAGDDVYSPPAGPPPTKDGIIR